MIDATAKNTIEAAMSMLEMEALLQPVSPEEPCGPDLQYDADFVALESASQGKPEQQYGDTIIPAESPNWKDVKRLGLLLLARTKDLRIVCHMARALADIDGLTGFCECLALIRGYVEQYWDGVHPLLDPEDDNDPTERVNILSSLADQSTTLALVLEAPLVSSVVLGTFSMRDVLAARGDMHTHGDDPPADVAAIEAAFMDCDLEALQETATVVEQGQNDAVTIEAVVTQKVGAANAMSLEVLSNALRSIHEYLLGQLRSREHAEQSGAEDVAATETAGQRPAATPSGEIRSREDVIRTLDKICEYYDRYEPSSPLPLLLKRAKRLVTKSFMDILEDLTPEGVSQARLIGGVNQSDREE